MLCLVPRPTTVANGLIPRTKDGIARAKSWRAMPAEIQEHWRTLGWVQNSWESDAWPAPASADIDFADLSESQQLAARALGYTEQLWNNDVDDPFVGTNLVPLPAALLVMKEQEWLEMAEDQRKHWIALGWSADSWNSGRDVPTSSSKCVALRTATLTVFEPGVREKFPSTNTSSLPYLANQ